MGDIMNSSSASRSEAPAAGSSHDGLENLEGRLWDRARRNLRLLYNGDAIATSQGQAQGPAGRPRGVGTPKI